MSRVLVSMVTIAILAGCGGSDTTTIINETTTVTSESGATGAGGVPGSGAQSEDEGVQTAPAEYSGPCRPSTIRVPDGANAGFENLRTVEANCEYGFEVATKWSRQYGPDCYGGCGRTIEAIPCEFDGSEVVCAAARTEVRWDIAYLEGS